MNNLLRSISHYFVELVPRYGVVGLSLGMFAESLGIPSASVVLDLTAGPMIVAGKASFPSVLFFSTLGLTLGSVASYYIGYYGADLGRRLFRRKSPDAERERSAARRFILKYGDVGILFAQFFGPARTWISLPAGAMKLDIKLFTLYTAIGGSIYCSIVIGFSYAVTTVLKGLYLKLEKAIGPYIGIIVIVVVAVSVFLSYRLVIYLVNRSEERILSGDVLPAENNERGGQKKDGKTEQ